MLVLDAGAVAEFGAPRELLATGNDGLLAKMVEKTGAEEAASLRALAFNGTAPATALAAAPVVEHRPESDAATTSGSAARAETK